MSATTQGVGRLLIWEEFAVGINTSVAVSLGYWDAEGQWRRYGNSYSEQEWRTELWGLFALHRRLSSYLQIPFVVGHRESPQLEGLGVGAGDIQAGVRYELLEVGEYDELPAVALIAGVSAPVGTPVQSADESLGADTTGRGAWVLTLGTSLEKTVLPWFARLNIGASLPLPFKRDDLEVYQWFGPGVQCGAMGGVEVTQGVVVSLFARMSWEADYQLDGQTIANSARTDVSAGTTLSWRLSPHWTLQSSVSTGFFVDGLGDNQPGRVVTNLGMRYGYF
ncbi:MAG: hypothetical protein IPJ88_00970 [Myxococcales bacterium]|nr:MAG: hypothetical protein IPJ88_00970 [Myxococcales bacterium]